MLVGVDGEDGGGVPEALADHLHGHAGGDEQGAVSVAHVVQPDHGYGRAPSDPLEGLGDGVGMDGLAPAIGEHPAGGVDGGGALLGPLPFPPGREHGDCRGVQVEASTRPWCLPRVSCSS